MDSAGCSILLIGLKFFGGQFCLLTVHNLIKSSLHAFVNIILVFKVLGGIQAQNLSHWGQYGGKYYKKASVLIFGHLCMYALLA